MCEVYLCDSVSPEVSTATLYSYTIWSTAIKNYAKLIPTHCEANLTLNVTYKVLRSPQLTY